MTETGFCWQKPNDGKNCRIQLLVVVILCKLKQNRKNMTIMTISLHKLCSQSSHSADC